MPRRKSILTISRDVKLQHLRTLVLEHGGYLVATALNDKDALRLVEEANSFDLVFLCHSVPESSRVSLVARIKELKPGLPVLVLYNGYDPTNAKVDGSLHNLDTPESMLEMVAFLTRNITV